MELFFNAYVKDDGSVQIGFFCRTREGADLLARIADAKWRRFGIWRVKLKALAQ